MSRGNARVRRLAAAVGVALVGGLPGCAEPPPTNLLLIVSDTLRADALSCYGGTAATPNLCGLAAEGALFERAYGNGPWTLPAAVALLTGSHASVHERPPASEGDGRGFYYVNEEERLLAERLRERGYRVLAFVENEMVLRPNALQGFELREVFEPRIPAAQAIRDAIGIDLSDYRYKRILPILNHLLVEAEGPFFALQWIMDPHAVYFPPRRFLDAVPVDPAELPHPPIYYARLESKSNPERETRNLNKLAPTLSEAELRFVEELYLREVESMDERVGYILEALRRRGLRDRTLVVFTSDHGEGFGEHGRYLHSGRWLYEEFVHVPLIAAGPGVAPGLRIGQPVSHVDLVPTLAELLGVPAPEGLQGSSLAALLEGRSDEAHRTPYIADTARQRGYEALVDGRYKLIVRPEGDELYDLSQDDGERRDLAGARPELLASLRRRLAEVRADNEARRRENAALGDAETLRDTARETRDQLEALGYAE